MTKGSIDRGPPVGRVSRGFGVGGPPGGENVDGVKDVPTKQSGESCVRRLDPSGSLTSSASVAPSGPGER